MKNKTAIVCIIVFFAGIALWLSGVDFIVAKFMESIDHPTANKMWRYVGALGLGRWQIVICLFIASRYSFFNKVALVDRLKWMGKAFVGAFYIWLRVLAFRTGPVIGAKMWVGKQAEFVQGFSGKARLWVYALPIMFGAGVVCAVLKILIGRPRPKMFLWHDVVEAVGPTLEATFHSFPSGHTTTTFALFAVVQRAYPKYTLHLFVMAALVSFARVGAVTPHFIGDVVAGAAIGYGVGSYLFYKYGLHKS